MATDREPAADAGPDRLTQRILELEAQVTALQRAQFAAEIARRMADEARMAAEEANHAKSRFLAQMSHELRTPLNAIIGFARVLRRSHASGFTPQGFIYLDRVATNGEHLLQLVNDILDLARVESGKDEITFGAVDLGALVESTVAELQGRMLAREDAIPVVLVAGAPAGIPHIESDALRLKQILINLVGNALKFTTVGSVTVQVRVDAGGVPSHIEVVDTGIGIPPDRVDAIFQPFEQASAETKRRFGGTGLGLAISSSLAAQLGYRITVASVLDVGSTFTLWLR